MDRIDEIEKRLRIAIEEPDAPIRASSYRDDISFLISEVRRLQTKVTDLETAVGLHKEVEAKLKKENEILKKAYESTLTAADYEPKEAADD